MTISDLDMNSWVSVGAQDAAKRTYASVRAVLETWPGLRPYDLDIFLQGSYANHTNTRGDSDVDIVVMMIASYYSDTSRLRGAEQLIYSLNRTPATLTVDELRTEVTRALNSHYGVDRVHPKNKCIKVDKVPGYVDADVVPCQQHRLYSSYASQVRQAYIEGISIKALDGQRTVNYPKRHIKNGQEKNARCHDRYKPTVRQLKRLRRRAVDLSLLQEGVAPGYVLECLVYNAPDSFFIADNAMRLRTVVAWLQNHSAEQLESTMRSCDEVHMLFRDDPGRHNEYTLKRVLTVLWDLL